MSVTKANVLDLDQQLCFALYTASRLVVRAYGPLLESLGITYPQYLVLLVLWERARAGEDPPTVRALGDRLHLDSGTLTPLLKRLEAHGAIGRARSARDEREVRVELTAQGRALEAKARRIPERVVCAIDRPVAGLGKLRTELQRLIAALEERE